MLLISRNADQQNLPRISVAENARESYIPSGIDVGIDFDLSGFSPPQATSLESVVRRTLALALAYGM